MFLVLVRLVYFVFKGDMKARKQCHEFVDRNYLKKNVCERCKAIRPTDSREHPMSYKKMGFPPAYAATAIDHAEYLRTSSKLSPWCQVPGFKLETVSYDLLHVIYLGIAKDHISSMIKYLEIRGYHYSEGETSNEFLRRLNLDARRTCKEFGPLSGFRAKLFEPVYTCSAPMFLELFTFRTYIPRRVFTEKNVYGGPGDYVEMGSRWKAAHNKVFCWWVAHVLSTLSRETETRRRV